MKNIRTPIRLLAGLIAGLCLFSACTPEQLASYERVSGVNLSPEQEAPLLAVPHVPIRLPDGQVVHPDGSVTPPPARFVSSHPEVDQWLDLALAVGWPSGELPKLSCVMWRESRGQPGAWNKRDPGLGSMGLVQINSVNVGFLRRAGVLSSFYELSNPETNLRAALALWRNSGWSPWRSHTRPC